MFRLPRPLAATAVVAVAFVALHAASAATARAEPPCAAEAARGAAPLTAAQRDPIAEMETFLAHQRRDAEGVPGACASAEGLYRYEPAPGAPAAKARVTRLAESQVVLLPTAKRYRSLLQLEFEDADGTRHAGGLIALHGDHWYRVTARDPRKPPFPSIYPEGGLLGALDRFVETSQVPAGALIEELRFNGDQTEARLPSGGTLRLDAEGAIAEFTRSHARTVATSTNFLDNHDLRVPPAMYELRKDPAFVEARESGNFTGMLDHIFRKALEVAKGDVFDATFISLLTVDQRERGPCGAYYGLRGRELTPRSIFDGEQPSLFARNRLDAPQHFFGYALLRQMWGGGQAPRISFLSKARMYYLPALTNLWRDRHSGSGGEAGTLKFTGTSIGLVGAEYQKERTRSDFENDLFYNELGIAFGERLLADPIRALPSAVVNDPARDPERVRLGLRSATDRNWQAYDPRDQIPRVISKPAGERSGKVPAFPANLEWMNGPDRARIFEVFGYADPTAEAYAKLFRDLEHDTNDRIRRNCFKWDGCAKLTDELLDLVRAEAPRTRAANARLRPQDIDFGALAAICKDSNDDLRRYNACRAYRLFMGQHLEELHAKWAPKAP